MIEDLRRKCDTGETIFACWCGLRDPLFIRHVAEQGFDAVVIDAQHGFNDEYSICQGITSVVSAGKMPIVRVPVDRWDMIQRVLDFGAVGTIAPMVNNRKDAQAFVEAAKYPTLGARSYGPRHAAMIHGIKDVGDYVANANQTTVTLAQIETREAFKNLDEILAVDGLDGILMGPQDFAIFMEERLDPKPYGPETVDAVRLIAEKTLHPAG